MTVDSITTTQITDGTLTITGGDITDARAITASGIITAGSIKISDATVDAAGTIQFSSVRNDFEGYVGGEWVSLTNPTLDTEKLLISDADGKVAASNVSVTIPANPADPYIFNNMHINEATLVGGVTVTGGATITGDIGVGGNIHANDASFNDISGVDGSFNTLFTRTLNVDDRIITDRITSTTSILGEAEALNLQVTSGHIQVSGSGNISTQSGNIFTNTGIIGGATLESIGDVIAGGNITAQGDISANDASFNDISAVTIDVNSANIFNITATTVESNNINVTNIKSKGAGGITILTSTFLPAATIANSTGVVTIPSSVLTTTDINGGTIDNTTIATSDITVGTGKTLNVSAGTLTLADNQINGNKINGGTIDDITITTLTSTDINSGSVTVTAPNQLIVHGMDVEARITDISNTYVKESNMAGQMDYGRFIETKSYNIPADAPVGTWKTFIGSAPSNPSWQAPDTGYYNLVGEGTTYTDDCLDNTVSYVNLQWKDASGNDYGSPSSNTTYGTTEAVLRDISGNDLIKCGDYIMIERDEPTNLPTTAPVDTALYDYYYWDYNDIFDGRNDPLPHAAWTGNGGSDEGPDINAYIGFGLIFDSASTGAFDATASGHIVFNWSGYEHNSGSTNNPTTFTNAYTNAGDYAFHFLFGANSTVANNWRNNQYPDLVELGSNYTFQNKRNTQLTTLLITRKDSNAFTFDSNRPQEADFGESPITDTHGNTISNPRWGFTDFKMVAECAKATLFVNQLYLYAGTELIAKFTPNASNKLALKDPTLSQSGWLNDVGGVEFSSTVVLPGTSGGYPNNYVVLGPIQYILTPLTDTIQIGRNSGYPFWREGAGTLSGMIKISRLARYPDDFTTPLDFTSLIDVSNSKMIDVYSTDSQFGSHLGEFETYTALRDISNGSVCVTELSNNSVFAVMTDASNVLLGNAGQYVIGVALETKAANEQVRILTRGYCSVRGDFTIQVSEDPSGVTQGEVALDSKTNGNIYRTDVSGILFTDSGGTTSNYNNNESYSITFDAGENSTIDLSINEIFTEHGARSLYDRLGFQVSEDGKRWENADIRGFIRTRPGEEEPPWPAGGTGTGFDTTAPPTSQTRFTNNPYPEMVGWILPETQATVISYRDQVDPAIVLAPGSNFAIISTANGDNMKRYIRFYFRSDGSALFAGWEILVKSTSVAIFNNVTPANSILYLSQTGTGLVSTFTGSGIRLGYNVVDSSFNNLGEMFAYARINDTNK
mgnify:FL=1